MLTTYLSTDNFRELVSIDGFDVVRIQLELEELIRVIVLLLQSELHRSKNFFVVIPQAQNGSQWDLFRSLDFALCSKSG